MKDEFFDRHQTIHQTIHLLERRYSRLLRNRQLVFSNVEPHIT